MGAKFDIQLETEESLKNSSVFLGRDGVKKGVFELARDHHRELESELKKMAPPNGRAVLLFRGRKHVRYLILDTGPSSLTYVVLEIRNVENLVIYDSACPSCYWSETAVEAAS
ncbi:hypothetical protein C3L33_18813, partial [Rhododendron williamsianum]